MSAVELAAVGSPGVGSSPIPGNGQATDRDASITRRRNVAALEQRGVHLRLTDGPSSPDRACPPSAPVDADITSWLSNHPAFQGGGTPPILVAGLRTSAMLRAVWQATRHSKDGYTPRLRVVEKDARVSTLALSEHDLRDVIADHRVEFFIGPDALDRVRARVLDRLDTPVQHVCVADDGRPSDLVAQASRMLEDVALVQEKATARLRARVAAIYAERDAVWWSKRFADASNGGEPLRVLLPSCRYTTFVQHAAKDLANAFSRRGVQSQLLIERDSHSKLSSAAYLDQLATFQPDLLVLINFPRASLGLDIPRNIPVVCWMQDAMPHLFDAKIGASQGPYDFVMGHIFPELYSKFGYPIRRTMPAVVVADGAKFHRVSTSAQAPNASASEIALVSHHSETPHAMHARLKREVHKDPAMPRVLDALFPLVQATTLDCMTAPPVQRLRSHADAVWRQIMGDEPHPRTLALLTNNYAIPLADRMLRHEMVAWAADLSRLHGWRFALYGRGWEKNHDFAQFARGELSHGDELRSAYATASVHLHCSLTSLVHQRVIECALSGGLCLLRLTRDAISGPRATLTRTLLDKTPDLEEPDRIGYSIADHAEAMAFTALLQRLGLAGNESTFWVPNAKADAARRLAPLHAIEQDANWAFGDISEFGFASKPQLEQLVLRAIESPSWRQHASDMAARQARMHLTHEALAKRLLTFVQSRFDLDGSGQTQAA